MTVGRSIPSLSPRETGHRKSDRSGQALSRVTNCASLPGTGIPQDRELSVLNLRKFWANQDEGVTLVSFWLIVVKYKPHNIYHLNHF